MRSSKTKICPQAIVPLASTYLSVEVNEVSVELFIAEVKEVILSRLAYRHNLDGSYKVTALLISFDLLKGNPVIDKDLLCQERLQLCIEELTEGADVVEHLKQVLQPLAEALEDAKDVLLAEVELPHLSLHLPVSGLDVSAPDQHFWREQFSLKFK